MLESDPQNISVLLKKGQIALQCLNPIDAQSYLVRALNLDPNRAEIWLQYGTALEKLGCYSEAITANNNAQKLYSNSLIRMVPPALEPSPAVTEAVAQKEMSPQYWVQQGHALGDFGDYEAATASFDRAIALEPTRFDAWFGRSNALTAAGRYEDAKKSYERATELNPQDYQVWNNFGYIWHQLGQYEQAVAHYDRALSYQPDCAPAINNRGYALFNLGLYETAIACYDQVIELSPNYTAAYHNRGNALQALGRYKEALQDFDRALVLNPNFAEVKRSREQLLQAMQNPAGQDQDFPQASVAELKPEPIDSSNGSYTESLVFPKETGSEYKSIETLRRLQSSAAEILQTLQTPGVSPADRKLLRSHLAEATQRQVDILAPQDPIKALELAEKFKDRCFGRLWHGWTYEPSTPTYAQLSHLLSPRTAVLYWHLSPETVTLLVLRQDRLPQHFEPQLSAKLSSADLAGPSDLNFANRTYQRRELESWLKTWTEDYQNFCEMESLSTTDTPWRDALEWMLFTRLNTILEIPQLCLEHLQEIDHLILVPHRELCLIPLHALFLERFTVTYLPSLLLGVKRHEVSQTASLDRLLQITAPECPNQGQNDGRSKRLFIELQSVLMTHLYGPLCTQVITEEEATKTRVLADLMIMSGGLSLSGSINTSENLTQSGITLAGQDRLTLKDLYRLDLSHYSFVDLTACKTTLVSPQSIADEYIDLIHGFMAAKATHVIRSYWNVNQISRVLLTIEFNRRLIQANLAPAEALVSAQCWLKTATYADLSQWYQNRAEEIAGMDPSSLLPARLQDFAVMAQQKSTQTDIGLPYAHPFYWAGFAVVGHLNQK